MPNTIVVVFRHRRRRQEVVVGPERRSGRRRPKPATATAAARRRRHIGSETAAATATTVARHRGGRGRRSADFVNGRRPFADGPRDRRRLPVSNVVVWHPVGHDHDLAQGDRNYGGGVGAPPAAAAVNSVVCACRRPETQKEPAH